MMAALLSVAVVQVLLLGLVVRRLSRPTPVTVHVPLPPEPTPQQLEARRMPSPPPKPVPPPEPQRRVLESLEVEATRDGCCRTLERGTWRLSLLTRRHGKQSRPCLVRDAETGAAVLVTPDASAEIDLGGEVHLLSQGGASRVLMTRLG